MQQLNLVVAISACVVVALGLVSRRIKSSLLSLPLLALAVGLLAGPVVLGWVRPQGWPDPHTILKEAARFTLAVSVAGIALRTPPEDYRKLLAPVALLLTVGMIAMWLVTSAIAWAILPMAPLAALLLGAALTPTDPVVASSIVTGSPAEENLTDRLRSTLSLESGANDGLGYLIVMLPLLLITRGIGAETLEHWVVDVIGIGVLLAIAIGALVGALLAGLLQLAHKRKLDDRHSMLSLSVAMSFLAVAGAKLAGSDGILAAFAAGAAFNLVSAPDERYDEENVQEAISKLFNLPIFVLAGILLPVAAWVDSPLPALFALVVLLLRRPIATSLSLLAFSRTLPRAEIAFAGWFGPIGVAAIYYSLLARERTGDAIYWEMTAAVVTASIVVHGVTAWPAMKALARRLGSPAS